LVYARKLADKLWAKCVSAGRGDLAQQITYIKYDPSYIEKKKTNKDAIEATKRRLRQCLEQR